MNEGGRGHKSKAYLAADLDLTGPLPVVRQFCIFSRYPYHEPGLGKNRTWAVLMVRGASSFDAARREILHDLEVTAELFPFYGRILQLLDESPDEAAHARKYKLSEALDAYIAAMPAPDHPFFQQHEAKPEVQQ